VYGEIHLQFEPPGALVYRLFAGHLCAAPMNAKHLAKASGMPGALERAQVLSSVCEVRPPVPFQTAI
jgi:hypothetical protein